MRLSLRACPPIILALPLAIAAQPGEPSLSARPDFDPNVLVAPDYRSGSGPGFSLLSPDRFSMRQSYSVNVTSGGAGTNSFGLYLNTLSYRLAEPLVLSMDVGVHTPFYSSASTPFGHADPALSAASDPRNAVLFPRVGLDYRPTQNSILSLNFINGRDALKAYGPFYPDPFLGPGSR